LPSLPVRSVTIFTNAKYGPPFVFGSPAFTIFTGGLAARAVGACPLAEPTANAAATIAPALLQSITTTSALSQKTTIAASELSLRDPATSTK